MTATKRFHLSRRTTALLLGLAALVTAAWLARHGYFFVSEHEVDAQLTFVGSTPDGVTDVALIVDADKVSMAYLRPGESERVTMAAESDVADLTLLFTLHGERRSWRGPKLPSAAGYRIALDIDGEGRVSEQHCLLPCPPW